MEEKDSVVNFLNEIASEKPELFKEEQSTEETGEVEEQEEKPLPFHKDPKVQRYVEKQINKALEGVKPSSAEAQFRESVSSDVKEVIEAFTLIIGNDTPEKVQALAKLEKTLNGSDERASQKAIERFKQEQQELIQKQAEMDAKAQEELDTYFDEIEETYDVDLSSNSASAKAMRSQFIDYVRKIAPKDENGEVTGFPDLVASFEEFQERNKRPTPTRAKELANRGMARSSDTSAGVPKFVVGKGDPWKQVEQHFDTLKANN